MRCYDINLMGSINLLEASLRSGVRRVVLASSSAVYGEREGPVSEDEAGDPLSPYAASKRAMESAAGVYAAAYGLPTVSLRYFNVYGPRQPSNSPYAAVIPRFIEALLQGKSPVIFGDGQQSRDFAYVEDVVSCNLLAAHADPPVSGVFNVGGGGSITINELAALLVEMIPGGKPPEYGPPRPGDIRHSRADLGKIQERLNFQPETELVSGLQRTVEWFRSNR